MSVSVESFVRQMNSVRRVTDYIGGHIDEDLTLDRLADVACLSPSHIDRLYARKVGESPFDTLRRLRLKRACSQILTGTQPLQDLALAAGYGSQAAFTRAFVRQFGHAPSLVRREPARAPAPSTSTLRLVKLPDQPIIRIPYAGALRESWPGVHRMMGELSVAGAKSWRTWRTLDLDKPFGTEIDRANVDFFVPASGQPQNVRHVDYAMLPGGLHAVYECLELERPHSLAPLLQRIERELQHRYTGGKILRGEVTCNAYTAPQERRIAYWLPVYKVQSSCR